MDLKNKKIWTYLYFYILSGVYDVCRGKPIREAKLPVLHCDRDDKLF